VRLRYLHYDVFTRDALAGNQLAVFLDGRGLVVATMQAVAREMNFSESSFILPPEREGTDRRMTTLWQWHSAEEFEHRAACSDALYALSGNYFVRVRGFFAFLRQVRPWQKRLVDYMIEVDRAAMTSDERVASIWARREIDRALARYMIPRMIWTLLPFYDPRGQRAPRVMDHALKHFAEVASQRRRLAA